MIANNIKDFVNGWFESNNPTHPLEMNIDRHKVMAVLQDWETAKLKELFIARLIHFISAGSKHIFINDNMYEFIGILIATIDKEHPIFKFAMDDNRSFLVRKELNDWMAVPSDNPDYKLPTQSKIKEIIQDSNVEIVVDEDGTVKKLSELDPNENFVCDDADTVKKEGGDPRNVCMICGSKVCPYKKWQEKIKNKNGETK